jgi:transposase
MIPTAQVGLAIFNPQDYLMDVRFSGRNRRLAAFGDKTTWGPRHKQWLQAQNFDLMAQRLVLQDVIIAAQHAAERLKRAEASLLEILPTWSLAPVVDALQALKGIRMVTAATIMAEIGDLRRFETPRQLMAYLLGLVPGEQSTGESVRRLGITKAGNGRVRRALVESAWSYVSVSH